MIKFLLLIVFLIFAIGGASTLLGAESGDLNPEQSLPESAAIIDETLGDAIREDGSVNASGIVNRVSQEVQNTSVHDVSRFFEI